MEKGTSEESCVFLVEGSLISSYFGPVVSTNVSFFLIGEGLLKKINN